MKQIILSKELSLPVDTVTQSIGILAKKRSGKSYCARKLAEGIFNSGQQLCIVDPKGDWWGIRFNKEGKGAGLPIIIFGGERGDLPLEVSSGALVAKLVVEERVSVLLDLSLLRKHEIATFMTIFMEDLYRLKAQEKFRTPLMLLVDEADAIAPQKPQQNEARMLGAAEDIVRRGGQRGIGCTMITQRSAVLNKNVLTQIQLLICLRTISPQDLSALDEWIQVHGEREQRKILMESLPSLPIGDAWFWSPGWPDEKGIFQRIHIDGITTYDSGATPKAGQKRSDPRGMAHVDLDALRNQMAETMERAKADDPKELKKKIAELEKQLKTKSVPAKEKEVIKKVEVPVLKDSQINKLDIIYTRMLNEAEKHGKAMGMYWEEIIDVNKAMLAAFKSISDSKNPVVKNYDFNPDRKGKVENLNFTNPIVRTPSKATVTLSADSDFSLKPGAQRILAALVQWSPHGLSEGQMRSHAGMKNSGSFSQYKSSLRTQGLAEKVGDVWLATQAGIDLLGANVPSAPRNCQEVMDIWLPKLKPGARRMLETLVNHPDHAMSDEDLRSAIGMGNSGSYSQYKSSLRTARLITTSGGVVYADKETLFL